MAVSELNVEANYREKREDLFFRQRTITIFGSPSRVKLFLMESDDFAWVISNIQIFHRM